MKSPTTVSIKQLHEKTGEHVRAAGQSRNPIELTDRGKVVALLVSPKAVSTKRTRRRLLPEYRALLRKAADRKATDTDSVLEDLDAVRGQR